MAEECAQCEATFATPAELVLHMNEAHAGGNPPASPRMNLEAERPGLVCALCGKRFPNRTALAQHALGPHYRTNQPPRQVSAYQSAC